MLSNLDLLRRVPLFSLLTVTQAEVISGAVTSNATSAVRCWWSRAKVQRPGHFADGQGARGIGRQPGREVILATLGPGDYIGEMSIIDNEPHSATVRAEVQTDVLLLGRADFARCLAENASMSLVVMRGLVKRLRHADRKIESLALLDVYGRVAHALLEFAVQDAQGQWIIREKNLAPGPGQMVGASREMVSRVMKDLEERAFIQTLPSGVTLLKERLNSLN